MLGDVGFDLLCLGYGFFFRCRSAVGLMLGLRLGLLGFASLSAGTCRLGGLDDGASFSLPAYPSVLLQPRLSPFPGTGPASSEREMHERNHMAGNESGCRRGSRTLRTCAIRGELSLA